MTHHSLFGISFSCIWPSVISMGVSFSFLSSSGPRGEGNKQTVFARRKLESSLKRPQEVEIDRASISSEPPTRSQCAGASGKVRIRGPPSGGTRIRLGSVGIAVSELLSTFRETCFFLVNSDLPSSGIIGCDRICAYTYAYVYSRS